MGEADQFGHPPMKQLSRNFLVPMPRVVLMRLQYRLLNLLGSSMVTIEMVAGVED